MKAFRSECGCYDSDDSDENDIDAAEDGDSNKYGDMLLLMAIMAMVVGMAIVVLRL